MDALCQYYDEHGEFECEVDAYGDFLMPCGPRACTGYIDGTPSPLLKAARQQLFDRLRHVPLHVIPLDDSKFYHIGTMPECLYHLCQDEAFLGELPATASYVGRFPESCVMSSAVAPGAAVGAHSIVEYCDLGPGCTIGARCLVSGTAFAHVAVPDDVFLQTVPVDPRKLGVPLAGAGAVAYATHVFGTGDDMKREAVERGPGEWVLPWAGLPDLRAALRGLPLLDDPWPHAPKSRSLWNSRMHCAAATPEDALALALAVLRIRAARLQDAEPPAGDEVLWGKSLGLVSLEDCVLGKHLAQMFSTRQALIRQLISAQ